MPIKKYIKIPIPVEVIQFNDIFDIAEIVKWSIVDRNSKIIGVFSGPDMCHLEIKTLEGVMKALPGYYIIKGPSGEFWGVKPEIFEATYSEVV